MRKTYLIFIAITITSCSFAKPSPQIQTPSSVIEEEVSNGSPLVEDFHLFGIRSTPDKNLAGVYSYTKAVNGSSSSVTYHTGIALVEPIDDSHWRVIGKYETIENLPVKPSLPIDYFTFSDETTYMAIFGPVLTNRVKTVEVIFADGKVSSEAISSDFYLIFSSAGSTACEIRALGENGQVLYDAKLFPPYSDESIACASIQSKP